MEPVTYLKHLWRTPYRELSYRDRVWRHLLVDTVLLFLLFGAVHLWVSPVKLTDPGVMVTVTVGILVVLYNLIRWLGTGK